MSFEKLVEETRRFAEEDRERERVQNIATITVSRSEAKTVAVALKVVLAHAFVSGSILDPKHAALVAVLSRIENAFPGLMEQPTVGQAPD